MFALKTWFSLAGKSPIWHWSPPPRRSAKGWRKAPAHPAARRILQAEDHVDQHRLHRQALAKCAKAAAITVEVVARASPHVLQVLRCHWVVKRALRYRRLARACGRTTANSEAMI